MKVLWDGPMLRTSSRGGVCRYCADLISELAGMEDTRVLTICPEGAPSYAARGAGVRQITLRSPEWINRVRIGAFGPEIFQGTYYAPSPVRVRAVAQIAYDFIDARLPAFNCNGSGFVARQRRALEAADGVIAISESTREEVLALTDVAPERVRVIPPRIAEGFRKPLPEEGEVEALRREVTGGAPYVLWVGPRSHYKNFITFLEAFGGVAERLDLHLVLVGGEARPDVVEQERILRYGIADRLHFRSGVGDETLRVLYAGGVALVQSSLAEGFGIPLVEALSCGASLLVSDIPVFHEVAGTDAVFVPPREVEGWREGLECVRRVGTSRGDREERKRRVAEKIPARDGGSALRRLYEEILLG